MASRIRRNGHAHMNGAERLKPELLIEYLYYAIQDVRSVSARGARLLEDAIATVVKDARGPSDRSIGQRRKTS